VDRHHALARRGVDARLAEEAAQRVGGFVRSFLGKELAGDMRSPARPKSLPGFFAPPGLEPQAGFWAQPGLSSSRGATRSPRTSATCDHLREFVSPNAGVCWLSCWTLPYFTHPNARVCSGSLGTLPGVLAHLRLDSGFVTDEEHTQRVRPDRR
jgi:hypothetical protein